MILENTKIIHAAREVVWTITRDIENWPTWTPTVHEVTRLDDGQFGLGSVAQLKQPGLPVAEWRVTEFRDGYGFTWETHVRGMHLSATHAIRDVESGVESTLRLGFQGVVAFILWPLIRSSARNSLELENAGLKRQCESR